MEQWSNRRPDQPIEDTEAVDVRPCRNGATSGTNAAVPIVSSTQIATDPINSSNWYQFHSKQQCLNLPAMAKRLILFTIGFSLQTTT